MNRNIAKPDQLSLAQFELAKENKIFDALPILVYAKNISGHYIFENKAHNDFYAKQIPDGFLGLKDSDLNLDANIDCWVEHDKEARKGYKYYQIDFVCDDSQKQYTILTYKQNLIDVKSDETCIIGYAQILNLPTAYLLQANEFSGISKNSRIKIVTECEYSTRINSLKHLGKLTHKESEILFYLLHGKTTKQIAELLTRSPRTVESHVISIKTKWQCNYLYDVLEQAYNMGLVNVIPKNIFDRVVR